MFILKPSEVFYTFSLRGFRPPSNNLERNQSAKMDFDLWVFRPCSSDNNTRMGASSAWFDFTSRFNWRVYIFIEFYKRRRLGDSNDICSQQWSFVCFLVSCHLWTFGPWKPRRQVCDRRGWWTGQSLDLWKWRIQLWDFGKT